MSYTSPFINPDGLAARCLNDHPPEWFDYRRKGKATVRLCIGCVRAYANTDTRNRIMTAYLSEKETMTWGKSV